MLKRKIEGIINDIRDPLMFRACQYESHAIDRHVLTDEELRRALWLKKKPHDIDDIVMVTRFESIEKALNVIADTLLENIESIEKWLLSDSEDDLAVTATFEEATGDGLVKNTDWSKTIPVHAAMVVIRKNFKVIGRSFVVVTGYPLRSFDDVDVIYDAIDEYQRKKDQ